MASNNGDAAKAEMVILAVKPQMYESVIAEVAPSLSSEAIVVSIAPGKNAFMACRKNGREKNRAIDAQYTCCHCCGMTSVAYGDGLDEADKARVMAFVQSFGEGEVLSEHLFSMPQLPSRVVPSICIYVSSRPWPMLALPKGCPGHRHIAWPRLPLQARLVWCSKRASIRRAERCRVLASWHDHRRPSRARGEKACVRRSSRAFWQRLKKPSASS